jgi:hypothetical protein
MPATHNSINTRAEIRSWSIGITIVAMAVSRSAAAAQRQSTRRCDDVISCAWRIRGPRRAARGAAAAARRRARGGHNDFLWAKILLLHAENLFIDFGAES